MRLRKVAEGMGTITQNRGSRCFMKRVLHRLVIHSGVTFQRDPDNII